MTMDKWLDKLIKHMEEDHDSWCPVGVVEIELTDDKTSGYSNYQHCRIKGDDSRKLYLKMSDEKPFGHYYVWQAVGCFGDDYTGWLLFPLPRSGKYLKVDFAC